MDTNAVYKIVNLVEIYTVYQNSYVNYIYKKPVIRKITVRVLVTNRISRYFLILISLQTIVIVNNNDNNSHLY